MKAIITWLYKKFVSPDIAAITREQVMGRLEAPSFDNLSEARKGEIIEKCIDYQKDGVINWLVSDYVKVLADKIVYEDSDTQQILAHRFSIDGASEIEKRIGLYAGMREQPEKFDKYSPIP